MIRRTPGSTNRLPRFQLHLERGSHDDDAHYKHILVPSSLGEQDRAALLLGAKMAALHRAKFTVLDIRPSAEDSTSLHWLDAIDRLFQTLEQRYGNAKPSEIDRNEQSRSQVWNLIRSRLAESMLSSLEIHIESLAGDFAEQFQRFTDQNAVDLVIIPLAPLRWWSSLLPGWMRQVLRRPGPQVILIGPDGRDT